MKYAEAVDRAAAAIANARAGRRGAPEITNVLEVLGAVSPKLLEEVREDARAALAAVGWNEAEGEGRIK